MLVEGFDFMYYKRQWTIFESFPAISFFLYLLEIIIGREGWYRTMSENNVL